MSGVLDPEHTKVIIVTLPETTPILEAEELVKDLDGADIHPWAWVINNSLSAAAPTMPLLAQRAANETEHIEQMRSIAPRMAIVATQANEPVGITGLRELTQKKDLVGAVLVPEQ